jgi:tyrosine-specific transport protein
MRHLINKVAGGALLIAGTAIGAGMLALPLSIGAAGFYNSLVSFFLSCLLMIITAFLLMEVYLWFDDEINITTAAKRTLGRTGELIGSFAFLFLLLAVNSAYISGASELLISLVPAFENVAKPIVGALFTSILGVLIYFGTGPVDFINRFMMIGLFASYLTLVFLSVPYIDPALYSAGDPRYLAYGWPIMVTSFAYQFVIPTLKTYMDNNARALGWSIFIGTMIPLVFFLFWVGVILGVLPFEGIEGISSLIGTDHEVSGLSDALEAKINNPLIPNAVRLFSVFALMTSLLGVSISLCDYFADLLHHVRPKFNSRVFVTVLALFPCYLFTVFYPNGFMLAIRYAAIAIAILLGILPVAMVWSGRYYKKFAKPDSFRTPGGKVTLVFALVLSIAVIVIEVLMKLDMLPVPAAPVVM